MGREAGKCEEERGRERARRVGERVGPGAVSRACAGRVVSFLAARGASRAAASSSSSSFPRRDAAHTPTTRAAAVVSGICA